MLVDLWPLFGLAVTTPRLQLRLPREDEIAALAELAARGVHRPGERPFMTSWTEGSPADRARSVLREHWQHLATWEVSEWRLGLGVFRDGEPIGVVTLHGWDFPVIRQVSSWSWLGVAHHGQGYGTEARAGQLALAFDHLGATAALSGAFQDNHASLGVSRKLGYEPDGITVGARDGEALVSERLRLTATRWHAQPRPPVTVEGLTPCLPLFGV